MKTKNREQSPEDVANATATLSTSELIRTARHHSILSFIGIFILIGLAFITAGTLYYRHEIETIRSNKINELRFIATTKAGDIANWRSERLMSARIMASGMVKTRAIEWLKRPDNEALKRLLLDRFRLFKEGYELQNVILADLEGRLLLSLDTDGVVMEARAKALAVQAVDANRPVFGNFFLCERDYGIHLDVAVPIWNEEGDPAAVILLRTDPNRYLYPLIQSWPTPSKTAETLLFCRDGDEVLFLNKLRHLPDPPLILRIPMTRTNVPSVQAAMGMKGVFEDLDYRGEPVLADLRPIDDSPWYMVAKVDTREILAEARYRARAILLFIALVLVLLGGLAAYLINERRRHLYKSLHRAERAAQEAEKTEQQLRLQLVQSQKLESIGTLAGGVTHEINNPIMGILGYAQFIVERLEGKNDDIVRFAREIIRETERVAIIVRNLLSFACHDRQGRSPTRLCDVVEATNSLIGVVMRHDHIMLKIDVPEDLPQIHCNRQQIQQVIMNLMTNARDALSEKYPVRDDNKKAIVKAECGIRNAEGKWEPCDGSPDSAKATLGKPSPDFYIRLTVEDCGTGIPPEIRDRIFEPFFTTKPRDIGTGLGLSISDAIVKEHGGELSVESEVGQWTRFYVDLPVLSKTEGPV